LTPRALGPAVALALIAAALLLGAGAAAPDDPPRSGLRVIVLDVGQGDAILFQPAAAPPILVDGGPHGDGLAASLRRAGVERLAAAVVTHDQSDHSGGIADLLGEIPVATLPFGVAGRDLLAEAAAAGARPVRIAAGGSL
jgi:competence protein ComEC